MTDVWINPTPHRPRRPRPGSQLEQDLIVLKIDHMPKNASRLAKDVETAWPHLKGWGWSQTHAYQRLHALMVQKVRK